MRGKCFDFLILKLFLQENIEFLTGARLQKIQQPTRKELIFNLRNHGESKKFYVNIAPQLFHICFMSSENERKRFIEIPEQPYLTKENGEKHKAKHIYPPMFCMLLRKYLEGAKIAKVCQPEEERILEFYFETYNELGEKIYLCLAIELMGKHSNVILYNYDTNVIIGCAHNVGSDKSRERELIGGLPYTYPSKHNNKVFSGLSSLFGGETSVSEFIDNYFAPLQEQEKIRVIKSKLLTVTKTKLRKINSSLEKIKKQSSTSEKADLYLKKGDLIMANLFHGKDFSKFIEVVNYETNSPLKIELDEAKTLKENANQFYKLYNKAKTANLKSQEMIENLLKEKEYLEQILYSIEGANSIEDLFEIQSEITPRPQPLSRKGRGGKSLTSHFSPLTLQLTVHSSRFTVFVGKNNKQNDYIVSKLARDEDLWFHVHNCAGSHVLLRIEAGQNPDEKIIFECAKLAKQYSSAKDSSKVGVIYTRAKNLKKPPGANLGYVIYKGEKEIIVD